MLQKFVFLNKALNFDALDKLIFIIFKSFPIIDSLITKENICYDLRFLLKTIFKTNLNLIKIYF